MNARSMWTFTRARAGSEWKGMTDWVSGSVDLDTALKEIDASWPEGAASAQGPTSAASSGEMMGPAGGFLERAMGGEFSGTSVSMMGPFTEEDAVKFNNAIADFEQATGIDIQYEGTKEFEATISVRARSAIAKGDRRSRRAKAKMSSIELHIHL